LQELASCADIVANLEEYAVLTDILLALQNKSTLLLTAYWDNLHMLPRQLIGPSIPAYEAFLDLLEGAEAACNQHRRQHINRQPVQTRARALHVYHEYVPDIQWPVDKTILIYSYVQIDNVLKTFGENNIGLSDALNRLGGYYC
jgi:hypothetical protein